jgi:hypothetical protein
MSDTLGTYSFIPWLRSGVANKITAADNDPAVVLRATFALDLKAKGIGGDAGNSETPVTRNVALYGPGDVIGIEQSAIVRTEPHGWVTNFEPNYLPYIDFYDEDFPHRYTPAAPSGARLRPWVALIVLGEDEFADGGNMIGHPLPYITIKATPFESVFPPEDEMWAWAHVQVDKGLAGSAAPVVNNLDAAEADARSTIQSNPDLAHSRLLCPRKLAPNKAYHAFLIPTFESGRLAGLGLDPSGASHATASSWGAGRGDAPADMPVYHRWYFRTGTRGDFEELVRLLKPLPADERVGRRDIDVQNPGSNVHSIDDPALEGVLKLGGALLAPLSDEAEEKIRPWEQWDLNYPRPFQTSLAGFLNLADDYERAAADDANAASDTVPAIKSDPDPLITPPIYGKWHALQNRLLVDADGNDLPDRQNWLHQLNLDPRWRSVAGFGTDVIVANQEVYMDAAWDQIGAVIEANRRIREAQLAERASLIWFDKYLVPMASEALSRAYVLTAPVHSRAMMDGLTVRYRSATSPMQLSATSAPLRRMLRPRGRLAKKLAAAAAEPEAAAKLTGIFAEKINNGEVKAAPSVEAGPAVPTVDAVSATIIKNIPGGDLVNSLIKAGVLPLPVWVLIVLLLILAVAWFASAMGVIPALVIGAAVAGAWFFLNRAAARVKAAAAIAGANDTPGAIDSLPHSSSFVLTPAIPLGKLTSVDTSASASGGTDSAEAARFKVALKENTQLLAEARQWGTKKPLIALDVAAATKATLTAIDPKRSVPKSVYGRVQIPERIRADMVETFVEAMAYPVIDVPMYKPLVDKSAESFVPNLRFIPPDSVTLLETNQPFIESYMVGLNHEFSRELLWREYVTDQRGSYFRQFWDVSGYLAPPGADPEVLRESLRDIPPIHHWSKHSKLGDHDNRELDGAVEEEVVLVVRGELLKKYPTCVIYARKAKWQPTSATDPTPNKDAERVLDDGVEPKSPLYHAKIEPDIYFFGFDLTVDEARGDPDAPNDPGWFFVFEERPGEPRFGLDVERDGPLQVWNDLSWNDIVPGITDGQLIKLSSVTAPVLPGVAPTGEFIEKAEQWQEDRHLPWTSSIHSGELAYILFQAPVRIAIHADEMLPR